MYAYPPPPPQPYGMQPGFQQPMFQQPQIIQQPVFMPPMGNAGTTIINIPGNRQEGTKCPYCTEHSESNLRRTSGCVTWSWCICLTLTATPFFFIPFCVDGCKDTEYVCVKCNQVKNTVKANCC